MKSYIVAKDAGATPPGWLDWNELVAREPGDAPPAVPRFENDVVSINYTSGTTARPKGT